MFATEVNDYNLHERVIDIWLCQSAPLQNKQDDFLSLLSMEEKSRAERFKFAVHRNRFIIFHGFMRTVLANYLNMEPASLQFQEGDKGKPYLDDNAGNSQSLQFNLSHTQDVALLAVTQGSEIGIDIEHIERKTDWKGVCRRFFTKAEQYALFSLPTEALQERAFYELWTRKEAYMKVLGSGLSLAPTAFTLSVPPDAPVLIQHHEKKYLPPEVIEFRAVNLPDAWRNYCATFAVASAVDECLFYQFS